MTAESASARLEHKVDSLITSVGELKAAHTQLADRMASDKRLTDQLLAFMQQAIDRVQSEVDAERTERKHALAAEQKAREDGDSGIRGGLSKVSYALFTALLALIGSGLAYVLFTAR